MKDHLGPYIKKLILRDGKSEGMNISGSLGTEDEKNQIYMLKLPLSRWMDARFTRLQQNTIHIVFVLFLPLVA